MEICALLYIENDLTDAELTFANEYLPDKLKESLQSTKKISAIQYSVPAKYTGRLDGNGIINDGIMNDGIMNDGIINDVIRREENDDVSFWKKLFAELKADHIIKIFCDSPFLDMDIISEMIDVHTKYLAEFTYSENLPSGFSCEIISKELLDAIPEQIEKTLPLSQVIKGNINRFDAELYFKEPDIRDKRISFRSGNPRDKQIMLNILNSFRNNSFRNNSAIRIPKYADVKKIIDSDPGVLYLCPSYVEIELTGRCQLDCIFCFRKTLKSEHKDMQINLFKKILTDMALFNLPYSVCFGGSGEPLMHENFYEILDAARNESLIDNIIIETNGILADGNFKNYLVNAMDKRIKIIFNLNGIDDNTYKELHKSDSFTTVQQNVLSIKNAITVDDNIYIQIMKINETESFLDKFYDYWEKHKIQIILQKQNTFLGRIKDRSYSDLSPLERTPCWHLQRDVNILSDGRVMFCKQDVNGEHVRGNLNDESIQQIFSRSKISFLNDFSKKYETNPDCSSCNEWYTFNL